MTEDFDWIPHSEEDKKAKSAFGTSLGTNFSSFYGSSVHNLKALKVNMQALGVGPVPVHRRAYSSYPLTVIPFWSRA